jgi:hypothetical protein
MSYLRRQLPAGFKGCPAYVTQNGWAVNLVNGAGVPGHCAMDMVRIWAPAWNRGAVFSANE